MNIASIRPGQTETVKTAKLGTLYTDGFGRTFAYAQAGAVALSRGLLTVAPTVVANHLNLSWETVPTAGDKKVTLTLGATAATRNFYEDGWLVVQDGAGQGRAYPIEGNAAADSAGTITVELAEAIDTTGGASEVGVDLIANPFSKVLVSIADQLDQPTGVPITAVGASEYFLLQTGGPAAVLQDETATNIGHQFTIGSSTVGAVEEKDAASEPLVGVLMATGAVDTEYQMLDLKIANAIQ